MFFRLFLPALVGLSIIQFSHAKEPAYVDVCRQHLKESGLAKDERVDNYAACLEEKKAEMRAKSIAENNAREVARYEAEVKARAQEKAEREARDKELKERYEKRKAEREARAQAAREKAEKERLEEQAAVERKREKCGEDYRKVRVGMRFTRVEQCVGEFELMRQVNRSDGIVSTYRRCNNYRCGFVHVMDGQVIAWESQ